MFFASDNAGPAHPAVMEALTAANQGFSAGYGNDAMMDQVRDQIRDLFEAPEAAVYLVGTGTAANALLLGIMAQPWDTVFCADAAHVDVDECGAPEFYTGGAKLSQVATVDGKMTPEALKAAIAQHPRGVVHGVQPGPLTITQLTESGTLHSLAELSDLTDVARDHGLPVHMDGARFANAIAALNCTPADMTWRLGVDTLSFGGTKNGLLGVEAAVIFDPAKAWEFELRRKRGAHLFSKHRYLSAQMHAYLTDDLWLTMARAANANAARLADGLRAAGLTLNYSVPGNMMFVDLPAQTHARLQKAGAVYFADETADGTFRARLVCDWSIDPTLIDRFIALL
ncbi:threonine aldolase family protein [Oceaniglobus ichthyenteri]|uniref:threonine aldolase family protein n=1 Tax=Oceaniglobus ichthyenteri TaxID=2136177 RepID=UPI000D37C573|nr:beta-eliminating lyase-related protein [Oceaniglobus ichthyenteri]